MRHSLRRIICRMTDDGALRDDLMQEALLHLWLQETGQPDQTRSWYLQSCRFHLQHFIDAGRSIDSTKRRSHQQPLPTEGEEESNWLHQLKVEEGVLSQVSARELMALLSNQLSFRDHAVLDCLAEGLGAREIARKLNVAHPTAIKSRRKIAGLVMLLGVHPIPKQAAFRRSPNPARGVISSAPGRSSLTSEIAPHP